MMQQKHQRKSENKEMMLNYMASTLNKRLKNQISVMFLFSC